FIAWAGLRGAVPIVLAIYPLMFGIEHANMLFQLVFFVVLASVTVQGWTLRPLARALGVAVPAPPPAPLSVEVTSLQNVDAEIVDYVVASGARAAHCRLDELGLSADMAVALVAREGEMIVPHGDTELRPGDHAF